MRDSRRHSLTLEHPGRPSVADTWRRFRERLERLPVIPLLLGGMGLCLFGGFAALLRYPVLVGKLDPSDQAFLSYASGSGSVGEEVHRTDEQLTAAGQTHQSVGLVLDETLEVRRDDEMIAALDTGSLLGEMSYVSGQPAT